MLKLEMIDYLQKIIKSTINCSENGCCDHIQKYNLSVEKRGRVGIGVWLQFGRGELGWGKRRRNRGRECRQSGYIVAFTDRITDETFSSVYPSVSPPVTVPRHCIEIPA